MLDNFPPLPGLIACLGMTVYVCPDCDGYEIKNKKTLILGNGNVGARMALLLRPWTPHMTFINHGQGEVDDGVMDEMKQKGIGYVQEEIVEVLRKDPGVMRGVKLQDGRELEGERGFIAFGGNVIRSELASQLGVERMENRHIVTDPRSKMTSVPGVWSAGDVNVHSEQAVIAMGEGLQCAIWIHKTLVKMDKDL